MNLPNGHLLQNGKYRLAQVVGQGGFGITYKGVWYTEVKGPLGTVKTEVPVCIKEYFFKDYCYRDTETFVVKVHSETGRTLFEKFKEKLIKEATILSEVHHPHIVNVLEVFEENGTAYIAMEYISGCSLKYRMEHEGVLPEALVLKYVGQIGEALQFVHEKSILHLDIKPSNILIDSSGKARLIDFGVSKRYDLEQQETSTTMLTLSKGFASIEQYDNEGIQNFSPCPDIYSLGATMYNLLTGKIPTESILRATKPLLSPRKLNPSITAQTEAVIIKAMQIVPSDRFQSVTEMILALDMPIGYDKDDNVDELPKYTQKIEEDEDDTTIVSASNNHLETDDEDEKTIVGGKNEVTVIPPHKKRKNGIILSFTLVTLACMGAVVALFVQDNKTVQDKPHPENLISEETTSTVEPADIPVQSSTQKEEKKEQIKPETSKGTKSDTTEPSSKKEIHSPMKVTATEVEKPVTKLVEPSEAEIDAMYSALISSGQEKMKKNDFENAQKDFGKAKKIKMTEEVLRLIIACDNQEKEKRLEERKAQYEEKMTFGNYKIVRKKSTGRYGTIDANAKEHIPCKYLNVGIAENGRAFEREDHLYDIYNSDGVLVNKGVTYY